MMKTALLTLALSIFAHASSASSLQDVICDDRERLKDRLVKVHGALKAGHGMRGPDALMEVWVAPRTGDWALVQSYANGTSCIVAMGDHWESSDISKDPA